MDPAKRHIRNGFGAVRPYVYGPMGLLDFVEQTFAAKVIERSPDGGQVELLIDDSVLSLALGEDFPEGVVTCGSLYVYVEDADATYALALGAGATSIFAPETKPYQERQAGVRDHFGNVWYISTYLGG